MSEARAGCSQEPPVVTGAGVITSIGEGVGDFSDALLAGRCGLVDGAGPCSQFDPESWMAPKEARRADRFAQLALAAAVQAADDAGLDGAVEPERLGVVIGSGIGGLETMDREFAAYRDRGDRGVSPQFVPMMMPNAAAALVAMRLGAHGPGFSLASACATGAHAIGEGKRMIERGEADVVLAGGAEAALVGICLAAFRSMGALSRLGLSRPFDERRDGFVMGEGSGVLVLESAEHARARGARVRARISGYGASNDAFHITRPDSDGRGAIAAMRAALSDAGAQPQDIGYINAHGTGTPYNDRIESTAIRAVFDGSAPPVSSTKGAVGHLLGAAGAVEAVATIAALEYGTLPPTVGHEQPDPDCDVDCVAGEARPAPGLRHALSSSFGFGGQNACLVVSAP